jgi:predicted transcriptional regulator of viral defense system
LYEAINLVDPEGYISGHGALSMHFMTDQDVCRWYSVSSRRQGDIRYGPFEVHFVFSPARAATATKTTVAGDYDVYQASVASVTQAFVDEVSLMPDGLDWYTVARMLGKALATQRTSAFEIASVLSKRPSMASARRLGFMIEMITGIRDPALFAMACMNKDATPIASGETLARGGPAYISDWRLSIPCSPDFVRMAGRDW